MPQMGMAVDESKLFPALRRKRNGAARMTSQGALPETEPKGGLFDPFAQFLNQGQKLDGGAGSRSIFEGIAITLGRAATLPAVHSASMLAPHGWRPASLARAGPGKATLRLCPPCRFNDARHRG